MHRSEHLVEDPATSVEGENLNNDAEVYHPQETKEDGSFIDEGVVVAFTDSSENDIVTVRDSTPAVQDDERKTSYASIVMKSKTASGHVYVPNRAVRVASAKSNQQWHATAKYTPRTEAFAPIVIVHKRVLMFLKQVIPYTYGTCHLMQQLNFLTRFLRNLVLLSMVESK